MGKPCTFHESQKNRIKRNPGTAFLPWQGRSTTKRDALLKAEFGASQIHPVDRYQEVSALDHGLTKEQRVRKEILSGKRDDRDLGIEGLTICNKRAASYSKRNANRIEMT